MYISTIPSALISSLTYIIREPGSTLLRVPHPSLLRVRGLNLLFSCSRCCGPNRSSSSVAVRCPIPPFPASSHNPFKHLHLQLFLDKDRNHVVICYLVLRRQSGHSPLPSRLFVPPPSFPTFNFELLTSASPTSQSAARLPRPGQSAGACPELLGSLDFSSLGLTLNFQLSTFNCLSFPSPSSPHLCALCVLCGKNSLSFRSSLTPRHSPLTTNSFIIRTSMTPLPQLLYNPHLQAPLGSAGNKGLITPLESALTKNSPATPLESALTETGGWGASRLTTNHPPPSLTFATLARDALSMTKTYLEAAIEIAQEAGKILIEEFSRPVDIRYKGDEVDLVTQADKRSEQAIVSRLTKYFPEHAIAAEEGTGHESASAS